jgi:hypothetical protein
MGNFTTRAPNFYTSNILVRSIDFSLYYFIIIKSLIEDVHVENPHEG